MTIVVGIGSPDGLILASDSRTTLTRDGYHHIGTDVADKLFILEDAEGVARYGVATYGWALIGKRTIKGLIDEYIASCGRTVAVPADVFELAASLANFFQDRFVEEYGEHVPDEKWAVCFILAGYDDLGIGHLLEIKIPGPMVMRMNNTPDRGLLMRGQTWVLTRLIKGVDRAALDHAEIEFAPGVEGQLANLAYPVEPPVALQDAADMATFLVRTTIDMQRFFSAATLSKRAPGCGGAIQMIAVTRAGATWLARRSLSGP